MPLSKRPLKGTVSIDGVEYNWHLHRETQWCGSDGWKGVAIAVELAETPCRELILEFPFERKGHRSVPKWKRPKISEMMIEAQIREAMTVGWQPTARGKPFVFEVSKED